MSEERDELQAELVASMIMEQRPDTLVVNNLSCESSAADGSSVWRAHLVSAGKGDVVNEEVRVVVSSEGELTITPL